MLDPILDLRFLNYAQIIGISITKHLLARYERLTGTHAHVISYVRLSFCKLQGLPLMGHELRP